MKAKLTYEEQGRNGYILYEDAAGVLKFYYEFGGGDAVVSVVIPDSIAWFDVTQRPLSDRMPLLTFMAGQLIVDKTPGCTFRIGEQFIEIWLK